MGIVQGFTDVIGRQNLATNGNFIINQRGLFYDFAQVKNNDFICDCWKYSGIVDYAEAEWKEVSGNPVGYIVLKGYGKRGQDINLINIAIDRFGDGSVNRSSAVPITAAVSGYLGSNSVPLQLSAYPSYYSSSHTQHYIYSPILTQLNRGGTAVTIMSSRPYQWNNNPLIKIILLADGEFYVQLNCFRMFEGSYKNPPETHTLVSEELLRCKRYYQTDNTDIFSYGISDGTYYYLRDRHFLPVEMAGTPTVSGTLNSVYEDGSSVDVKQNYSFSISYYATQKTILASIAKTIGGSRPSQMSYSYVATL